MVTYAPIILFVYNRPEHTMKTVEALRRNKLASESNLYIFADGPKDNATDVQRAKILQVRKYIATIDGFKEVHIESSEKNKGLANSVIDGVTKIVNKYGRVIVLEDDIVISSHFLQYMNQSLDLYELEEDVICIHGYSIIKDAPINEHTYFQYGADCWGWATWKRGWSLFNPDAQYLMDVIKRDPKTKKLFTYNGTYPYMEMLQAQIDGRVDSWAVRWYASAVINRKLCLFPSKSLVRNIGFGNGTHTNDTSSYEATIIADESIVDFPKIPVIESSIMRKEWESLYKRIYPNRNHSFSGKIRMKINDISKRIKQMPISDFIPPVLYKFTRKFKSHKRLEIFSTLNAFTHVQDTVFVVGNGPSLKKTMEKHLSKISSNDVIAVNCLALTDYFLMLKPLVYLLVDPIYWDDKIINPTRDNLYDKLIADTAWPMTIVFPDKARTMKGIERFAINKHIRLLYFNTLNVTPNVKDFMAWDNNLVAPPTQTVMNTALYMAIKWRYSKIYIIGADSSFLADLHVDQNNNKLYSLDTHFYSNKTVYKNDVYQYEGEVRYFPQKLHEELLSESIAFSGYWDLRYYAEYAGVKVYNASEVSWIDAFERKRLD